MTTDQTLDPIDEGVNYLITHPSHDRLRAIHTLTDEGADPHALAQRTLIRLRELVTPVDPDSAEVFVLAETLRDLDTYIDEVMA